MTRMNRITGLVAGAGCLLLSACAEMPDNPTVDVAPPPGTSWQAFSGQREYCKHQAEERVRHSISRANTRGIIGGVVATALGAGLGAAAGGAGGAAIGAGAGALAGTAGGGLYSNSENGSIQSAYNIGYLQCMRAESAPASQGWGGQPQSYGYRNQAAYTPSADSVPNQFGDPRGGVGQGYGGHGYGGW